MTGISMKALGLLVLAISCSMAHAAEGQPTKEFILAGTAVTPNGSPVSGARVFVFHHAIGSPDSRGGYRPVATKAGDPRTDSQGRFKVDCEVPAHGFLEIVVEKEGFVPASTGGLSCDRFDPRGIGRLVMRSLRAIEGRVIDSMGKPVAEVGVFQTGNTHERTATVTDADGRFKLAGMPDGPAAIFVRKSEFRFHGQFVKASQSHVELTLLRQTEPATVLKTLPPTLSKAEEQEILRRLLEPLWKKAIESGDKQRLSKVGYVYAMIDPWEVRERLGEACAGRIYQSLYRANPEETLALVESDVTPSIRCYVFLKLFKNAKTKDFEHRLELLDFASRHARALPVIDDRIYELSEIAIHLFELGETQRAKELIVELERQRDNVASDSTVGRIADALALVDPDAAIRMASHIQDVAEYERYNFRIAYRLADREPIKAQSQIQRMQARAQLQSIACQLGSGARCASLTFTDIKTVAVCHRMAKVDRERALAIAENMRRAPVRAYAKGMVAEAIAADDLKSARKLILEAFADLEQPDSFPAALLSKLPEHPWIDSSFVAAALLPVAESIDPTLVRELFWRSLALRPLAISSRSTFSLGHDTVGRLAPLLARYDRSVGRMLIQQYRDRLVEMACSDGWYGMGTLMALIEPKEAQAVLAQLPEKEGDQPLGDQKLRFVSEFAQTLSIPGHLRWYGLAATFLWRPEPELLEQFNLVW